MYTTMSISLYGFTPVIQLLTRSPSETENIVPSKKYVFGGCIAWIWPKTMLNIPTIISKSVYLLNMIKKYNFRWNPSQHIPCVPTCYQPITNLVPTLVQHGLPTLAKSRFYQLPTWEKGWSPMLAANVVKRLGQPCVECWQPMCI